MPPGVAFALAFVVIVIALFLKRLGRGGGNYLVGAFAAWLTLWQPWGNIIFGVAAFALATFAWGRLVGHAAKSETP